MPVSYTVFFMIILLVVIVGAILYMTYYRKTELAQLLPCYYNTQVTGITSRSKTITPNIV